jgi:hypothetical protein
MIRRTVITAALAMLAFAPLVMASGPVGIYGIVDKMVFEPDEKTPERVQVWGAFMYVDGGSSGGGLDVSRAARGYLYFTLPRPDVRGATPQDVPNARREWADMKRIAGTNQAIGFGTWGYIGWFGGLSPDATKRNPPYILQAAPHGGDPADLRVRPASEAPERPAAYQTDAGIVKLMEGSHAEVIKQLRDALRR